MSRGVTSHQKSTGPSNSCRMNVNIRGGSWTENETKGGLRDPLQGLMGLCIVREEKAKSLTMTRQWRPLIGEQLGGEFMLGSSTS